MKILSIKRSSEFKQIAKNNQKFYSTTLVLLTSPTPAFYLQDFSKHKNAQDFCRVGYTVSKKVGKAIIRNRAKRRLREAMRALASLCVGNRQDYILIARAAIADADYSKIFSDLKFCLKNIHRNHGSQGKKQ